VQSTTSRTVPVITCEQTGVVSHAGTVLLAELADRIGLTTALSEATDSLRERRAGHDPGRVLGRRRRRDRGRRRHHQRRPSPRRPARSGPSPAASPQPRRSGESWPGSRTLPGCSPQSGRLGPTPGTAASFAANRALRIAVNRSRGCQWLDVCQAGDSFSRFSCAWCSPVGCAGPSTSRDSCCSSVCFVVSSWLSSGRPAAGPLLGGMSTLLGVVNRIARWPRRSSLPAAHRGRLPPLRRGGRSLTPLAPSERDIPMTHLQFLAAPEQHV